MNSLPESVRQTIASSELHAKLCSKAGAAVALITAESLDILPIGKGISPATPMEIGSVTKVFTALLVADAIRRSEIQLSTQMDDLLFAEHWPGAPAINVEQLATHTSGLPRLSFSRFYVLRHPRDPYRNQTREKLLAYLNRNQPRAPDAPAVSYSNFGYAVLGLMLEKATSKTYPQLLQERLLDPLKMHASGLHLTGLPDRAASGHSPTGRRASIWHLDAYAPCGALVSTIDDLALATRALLSPESPIAEFLHLTLQPRAPMPGGNIGLAWILPASGNSFWHNGATAGYTSYLGVYKPLNTGVVILANQALPNEATQLGHQLMRVLAQT